jgi:hypothetical protein
MNVYYHAVSGKAFGPSLPRETLEAYKARVRRAYGNLRGVEFGTRETLHPAYFY